MPVRITITEVANRQLRALTAREQRVLETAIVLRLQQPTTPTRAVRLLRPNPLAQYELRVGDLRVLYSVQGDEVILLIVGRKVGNQLIVEGEAFRGHQDHSVEPPGSGPRADPE